MSGQTIVSRKALQFTNDNKKAYAFSGEVDADVNNTLLLEFNTESYYLDSKIYIYNSSGSADDFRYSVLFNNIVIVSPYANSSNVSPSYFNPIETIIPPHTNVQIRADNVSSVSLRNHTAHVIANVGMAPRVGNLDE